MPFKRRRTLLVLILAGVGFFTSMPALPHLRFHPGAKLHAPSLVQLDDDEDRELMSALAEPDREERDGDPDSGDGEG